MSKGRRKWSEREAERIGLNFKKKRERQYGYVEQPQYVAPVQAIVPVKAKTKNQAEFMALVESADVSFCLGPPGSGKTHIAVGMADRYLANEWCEKVILCRPAVGVGRSSGFLPGKLEDKLAPFLRPLFDEYGYFRGRDEVRKLMKQELIEIASLEHMQGRTLRNAVAILDEAQNATHDELWMFLTRLGEGSKLIITGDLAQSMIHPNEQGGLLYYSNLYRDAPGIGVVHMNKSDIVRHRTVQTMITIKEQYEADRN